MNDDDDDYGWQSRSYQVKLRVYGSCKCDGSSVRLIRDTFLSVCVGIFVESFISDGGPRLPQVRRASEPSSVYA